MFNSAWKELFSPKWLSKKSKSQKIAYVAMMAAFSTLANAIANKSPNAELSFTIAFSGLIGISLGAVGGFVACFIGDFVGWLIVPMGAYLPPLGISSGLFAVIFSFINVQTGKEKKFLFVLKILCACVLSFLVCTVLINTTTFWVAINGRKVPYWSYLWTRLATQIWNSLTNYALLFIAIPFLERIKIFNR